MSPARFLAAALLLSLPGRAAGGEADAAKAFRDAFKPLRVPPLAALQKELEPLLPGGIVIEAEPFLSLVARLLKPHEEALAARERALGSFGEAADAPAAVAAALKVLEKEAADLRAQAAAVEAAYAEVWDADYMASSEKVHRTRKSAAILLPFYRTLVLRAEAAAARMPEALARSRDPARAAWLANAVARDASPAVRAAAAGALGRLGGPGALDALRKARAEDAAPGVRAAALRALLAFKPSESKDALVEALADPAWEVRSLAAAACGRIRLVAAADALVRALEGENGRLERDLDDALHAIFGVRFAGDAKLWRRWLTEHAAEIEAKAKEVEASGALEKPPGPPESWETAPAAGAGEAAPEEEGKKGNATSSFYGIDTTSRRVLFIVDISRSMEEPAVARPPTVTGSKERFAAPEGKSKIDVARWQLHRAVEALPKDAVFNIVLFSESYRAWQEGMQEAAPAAKAKAHAFIDSVKPNGMTNIADSLDEAFDLAGAGPLAPPPPKGARPGLAVDTVYLLTDGNPNRGRLCDPDALVAAVVERNRAARLVLHVIGIGEVAGSEFLKSLARRTGGQYVGFR